MSHEKVQEHTQAIEKGFEAQRILENPLVISAFVLMKEKEFKRISESKPEDWEIREDAYRMLKVIDAFEGSFLKMKREGSEAKSRLKALAEKFRQTK